MALDRTRVIESAQKYLAKGHYDKAIGEYHKLVKEDPSDVRTWLKIGDLYTRKGARREACETYGRVAQQYADQGFFLKAVAVYKQILKLDPSRLDTSLALAEMYEQLQLVSDALNTYEMVAAGYARAGDIDAALHTLGKMADLDPDNIPVRIKYAEALSKAGRQDDAAESFAIGAGLLKEQGRVDDYIKVAERLLYHRPSDLKLAQELAQLYVERGDPKRALSRLQLCFKADPKNVEVLGLLAKAFHLLGQLAKTVSVYREVARIHHDAGRHAERAQALKHILELDAGDHEARQALAAYAASKPGASTAHASAAEPAPEREASQAIDEARMPSHASARPQAVDDVQEAYDDHEGYDDLDSSEEYIDPMEDELMVVDEDDEFADPALEPESDVMMVDGDEDSIEIEVDPGAPAAAAEAAPAPTGGSLPPDVELEAQVSRLLTECDVFMRYGLMDKVIGQLQRVLDLAPAHAEARERLKDAYLRQGNVDSAIAQLLLLAEIQGADNGEIAAMYFQQVLDLEPTNPAALAALGRTAGDTNNVSTAAEGVDTATGHATAALGADDDLDADDDILFVDDDGAGLDDVDLTGSMDDVPAGTLIGREDEEQSLADVDLDAPTGTVEALPVTDRTIEGIPADEAMIASLDDATLHSDEPMAAAPPGDLTDPSAVDDLLAMPMPNAQARAATIEVLDEESIEELDVSAAAVDDLLDAADPLPEPLAATASAEALLDQPFSPEEFDAGPVEAATPAAASPEASMGEVEEVLDEVEFYFAQQLWDEASESLNDALSSHPGHPLILEKLAELEILKGQSASAAALAAGPADDEDESFLLAQKLAEELDDVVEAVPDPGSDVLDVESVFAQFKKGVQEQISADDSDTHFDLGIAYKEMGLIDDAIGEFELSRRNPMRECMSCTMIGLCNLEKNEVATAISFFKKGLYAENKTDGEELGLYFELGAAYERLADAKEALYYYQKVQKREPTFRAVQERIEALSKPEANEPQAPPDMDLDDVDRAFDDLLGD